MFEYCRLYVGQHQSLERLLSELLRFEYRRVDEVLSPGDVAVHGGNLDLFPGTFESPLRVEFDAARVISIRSFNPKTFETLDRHTMVVVLPRRVHAKVAAEIPFEASIDLKKGDAIVHLEHGIGRFLGRVTLPGKEGEDAQENMVLEYAGNDRLYVPLTQLHLVQKYMGFGSGKPALHTLGGTAWARAKAKAFAGAWSYANSLLELQAKRLAVRGFGFPKDHEWQSQFEAAFPFRETPDQLRTTNEVKQDMEQARRLGAEYLVKPVRYADLLELVERYCRRFER
ncbi:MAG: hypothetical protein HYT88_03450 [Candidatus Omnitrophica bacterium]|nr:hypothetical protein [Candidatus Omnitrophota bacterium]